MHRYSERALVKVAYTMAFVIVAVIAGISFCVDRVLEHIA